MSTTSYSKVTPEIEKLAELSQKAAYIEPSLYTEYDVKRGLRDLNGKGVLVGITNISEINGFKMENGQTVPIDGELFFRGYNVKDIIKNLPKDYCMGFELCAYLLLFGEIPSSTQLEDFREMLSHFRVLPKNFFRDVIMKKSSPDMMNMLSRSVLMLYSYDEFAEDPSPANILRQCMELIAKFPIISVYGYRAYRYYHRNDSLIIHRPKKEYSTAENILHCIRDDGEFTPLEAKLLDVALILHSEHGGGNNSTFTTHLLSSSGTDTYSTIAGALGSLKGPKHGGANHKVVNMIKDLKKTVENPESEDQVASYLEKLVDKEAFDKSGLIYGIGHAIYSVSDPRALMFKSYVEQLAKEKGREKDYELYLKIERLAPEVIANKRKMYKGVSPNVDFYSGFAYQMLGLPEILYTPIFAIARIAGWSAHRMEEVCHKDKIMRPAYMTVHEHRDFSLGK